MSENSQDQMELLEEEGDIAADYLEELLDIADLDGDIEIGVENGRAAVAVISEDTPSSLPSLVGDDGEVLEALQELTRLAVQASTGERSRLMLDIAQFRANRKEQLRAVAQEAVEVAKAQGQPVELDAMNPFERKVCHDAIADAGLLSESKGSEPNRRVVVLPPSSDQDEEDHG